MLDQIVPVVPSFFVKLLTADIMANGVWKPLLCGINNILLVSLLIYFMPTYESSTPRQKDRTGILDVFYVSWSASFLIATFFITNVFGQLMSGIIFLQYFQKRLDLNIAEVHHPIPMLNYHEYR